MRPTQPSKQPTNTRKNQSLASDGDGRLNEIASFYELTVAPIHIHIQAHKKPPNSADTHASAIGINGSRDSIVSRHYHAIISVDTRQTELFNQYR